MRKHTALCTTAIMAVVTLAATGCGKKGPAPASSSASSSARNSSPAGTDYSKPALTEEKISRFIDSMKEKNNPLEFIFKAGGQMRGLAELKAKEIELNAFARRYGFKDYTEYIDTWGRVMVGQMQIGAAKMMKSMTEMTEKSIKEAEDQLKKPDLTAEQRQMYTDQIEQGKKSIAGMNKTDANSLNAADLALVEKYNEQINAAAKAQRGS
jgi:predicted small lipoprotein YifL